jgi:hypothetical protein
MKRRILLLTALAAGVLATVHAPVASALPPTATTTTVTATPDQAKTGAPITYSVAVSPAPSSGTVTIYDNGVQVADCGALAITSGTATCATTASKDAGLHFINAMYSGGGAYQASNQIAYVPVVAQTTTVATASPKLASPGETMTYTATVTPRPTQNGITSVGDVHACSAGCGNVTVETVDFAVDGQTVAGCTARKVNTLSGVATCTAAAPTAGGPHVLTVKYSGSQDDYLTASTGTGDFAVKSPAVTVSTGAVAFGSVTVGASGSATVTVTAGGTGDLQVGALGVSGPFTVAANGCATLAPGASCVITLAFAPTTAGAATGNLTIDTDAGAQSVALTGSGVAPVTAVPPTGATLPPNASTTFTATTSSSGPSTVTVPLRCPNGVACTLDGTVVIATGDLTRSKTARAAAAETKTVARFSGVRVAAGKVKAIKLKLSPSFIKTAQKRGVRFIHAVLTVNTTFADGTQASRQERVTIRIPKAVKKKAAVAPRFTG